MFALFVQMYNSLKDFETLHNIYSLFLLRKKAYKTEISTD